MLPGVNPRQLKAMMKQMGMSQDSIAAESVIIKTREGKTYVFQAPDVQKISMQGQISFQITGSYKLEEGNKEVLAKKSFDVTISEDDVELVSGQAGVSKVEARKALENSKGDIAEAIVSLSN